MIPEEPRTPYEDDESPLDEAASDAATPPDAPASPTDTLILPPSGGPPRVVAETPVGGLRPVYRAPSSAEEIPLPAEEEVPFTAEDVPALEAADEGAVAEAAEVVSETPVVSAEAEPPAEREPDDDAILAAEPEPEAEPVAAPEPRSAEMLAETAEETATEVIAEIADAAAAEVPDLEVPASVVRAVSSAAESPPAEPEPAVAPAATEEAAESLDSAQEWDEDLSPALAAVLFGSPRRPPAEAAPEAAPAAGRPSETVAEAAPPAARPRAAQVAGPIRLTEETQARALPLTAGEQAAPAPDVMLTGKVRHTRLEEPLKDEGGERVVETWDYFKPDYPGLDGQLVRAVRSEEERFSDGSWRWRYERQYADGGRDRREVRANADRTYFERADEIALRDPETGKRQQIKEEAGMIFAPPPREEKRGLLSSLLRRGDDQPTGPASWRAATPGEMRQASRDGGRAFKRGLFG
ncbi:MAG: hypothetical protein M5U29_17630 [Anaerolineae bacterium]|nr:hypothetical protein [Anaerolineae bacterium]